MPAGNANVVWARCSDPAQLDQLVGIEQMLEADGDSVSFLTTLPDPRGTNALQSPLGQRDVRQFIFEHKPVALLWIGGAIEQGALAPCYAVDLPVLVLNGSDRMLTRVMGSWMPNRARTTLARIHAVFAEDEYGKDAFIEGGVPAEVIQVSGSVDEVSAVLPYRETDREELAQALETRPVWLAASARPADVAMLCSAHKEAARRAHRLVLIIAPARIEDGSEIAALCTAAGLNAALRSQGAEPEEATQVYIADEDDGMGLWYRLAPMTFMCGTFGAGALDDPYHGAALGSVIIHGPVQGAFGQRFARLIASKATLPIKEESALGDAVAQLLAVDQAAIKANAGWDVTSRGAGAAIAIAANLQAIFDEARG